MSNKKKSFILHHDSLGILKKLDDEQAGKLFKAITNYSCNGEIPSELQTELLLFPFQSQFDRDTESYEKVVNRNKSNGLKGGRPKNPEEPKEPSGLSGLQKKPKKADSDSDSDSDSEKATLKELRSEAFDKFWDLYNKKEGSAKCKTKWNKLKPADIDKIFIALPNYVSSTPEKQYRKNPLTWLNGEHWNDDIQNATQNDRTPPRGFSQ